jgi:zinc transport system ATP-binding protein
MMDQHTLINAKGICVTRLGKNILRDAELTVQAGEIVTLVGPNGAGKSTLVKVMLGLEQADIGQVEKRSGLSVGYMPQRLHLDATLPLSVKRFISLAERSFFAQNQERIDQCLALTGTEKLKKRAMTSLSGGEFQRVLLARAFYNKPQLLVLDEPVQGVDVGGQAAMYELIHRIREEWGCGILMISHDLHLVMAATDRVVCLNQHVCCEGHPDSVSAHPEFLRLFGESTEAEVAIYTHEHDHQHDHFGDHTCTDHSHD